MNLAWRTQLKRYAPRATLCLVAWVLFMLLYPFAKASLGVQASGLVYLPVLTTAYLGGIGSGVAAAIIGLFLNSYLLGEALTDTAAFGVKQALVFHTAVSFLLSALVGQVHVLRKRLKTQREALETHEDRLEYHAYRDPLTGLYNRERFEEAFKEGLESLEEGHALALFLIDLDDFKRLNDSFGQATGDELIRQVGLRLNTYVTQDGILARLAGDEFILLTPVERLGQAGGLALRLLDLFREPFILHDQTFFVRASVGISFAPRDGRTLDTMLRAADSAMYRVKRRGKGSYESYSPSSHNNLNERFDLEYKLRDALECQELELYYQPQVEVQSGQLWGLEALLRWYHPDLGLLSPDRFIDIAEHTGLIVPIGAWVLETACTQQRRWEEVGIAPSRIAVNVSTVQFSHPGFYDTVVKALNDSGLAPTSLELEITEGALMTNMSSAKATLSSLCALGIGLSIDDFGVGYSSLSYLQQLPIDTLKIDRSFLPKISDNKTPTKEDTTLIRAIIGLAHGLEKTVITEGVDSEIHIEFLRQVGCEYAQGYYFGRPIPPDDIEKVLSTFNWNIRKSYADQPAPVLPLVIEGLEPIQEPALNKERF